MKPKRLRTVVCGSTFGQFYIEALKRLPDCFQVVGLLAKGSDRSLQCADRYGIDLYTDVEQLPDNTDLACVVLRSGVMGGDGSLVSLSLLDRGIHVIQEQPVHHKDLASCLKLARKNGVHFRLGDLYVHLPAVQRFIACANAMFKQQDGLYIDAACATQVSFPMMHILLEALPALRPFKINHVVHDEGPFQLMSGVMGKIPFTLRAHNEVDPDDPDNHLHLLHAITLGVAGGSHSLTDTHGPVEWRPRLHIPKHMSILDPSTQIDTDCLPGKSTQALGPSGTFDYKALFTHQWPEAIGRDLLALRETILGKHNDDARAQQELLIARQWHDVTHALGYPVLRPHRCHRPLSVDRLKEAAAPMEDDLQADPERRPWAGSSDVYTCTEPAEREVQGLDSSNVSMFVQRLDTAVFASMLHALQSQGTLTDPGTEYAETDIFSAAQVAPCHQRLVSRWLGVLADRRILHVREGGYSGADRVGQEQVDRCWMSARELWDGTLGSPVVMDYFIGHQPQLPQLLRGEQQAAFLLFPEGRLDIANALYRETAAAKYLNTSVAEAVVRIAAEKRGMPPGDGKGPLRIVEMGAGTGATTEVVTERIQRSLATQVVPDYLFTDISHFFISAARQRFNQVPWMRFKTVDIDKNLFAQGVEAESADIVIAAGMLNNARDTDDVIQGLMQVLVPGGWMLITEPTREYMEMLISQAFMMPPPVDDRKTSETTFLSVAQWREVLEKAGAVDVAVLPDGEHPLAPLGQKLFVVRKGYDA